MTAPFLAALEKKYGKATLVIDGNFVIDNETRGIFTLCPVQGGFILNYQDKKIVQAWNKKAKKETAAAI